jgi:hypothetical protein
VFGLVRSYEPERLAGVTFASGANQAAAFHCLWRANAAQQPAVCNTEPHSNSRGPPSMPPVGVAGATARTNVVGGAARVAPSLLPVSRHVAPTFVYGPVTHGIVTRTARIRRLSSQALPARHHPID